MAPIPALAATAAPTVQRCACGRSRPSPRAPGTAASAATGDWPIVGHDTQGTRFIPLDQITTTNVAKCWGYQAFSSRLILTSPTTLKASSPAWLSRLPEKRTYLRQRHVRKDSLR